METPECYYGGYGACTPEKQGKAGAGGGDHFIVEDLFDFSNEEDDDAGAAPDGGEFGAAAGNSAESSTVTAVDSGGNSANRELGFPGDLVCRGLVDSSLSGDLCEPYDELAELEWLSNFVEESFSSEDLEKLQLISGLKAGSGSGSVSASSSAGDRPPQGPVPGKARSKRSRAAPCSWSSRLLALSPPLMSTDSSSESEIFIPVANPVRKTPPLVAPRKKELAGPMMAPSDRRCLHCQTDKTPQWRTGPMGPKTLCNACGVRYKSGRLVPEYRPAASPTFVLSKHSNSHRKVLELRRQKEVIDHHHQYQHPHHPQYHHQQFLHGSVYDPPGQSAAGDDFLIHHHIGPDYRQLI